MSSRGIISLFFAFVFGLLAAVIRQYTAVVDHLLIGIALAILSYFLVWKGFRI